MCLQGVPGPDYFVFLLMIHFTFFIYCSEIPNDFHLGLAEQRMNVFTGQLTAVLGSLQRGTVSQRGLSSHVPGSVP